MGKNFDSPCKGGDDCYSDEHLCRIAKRGDVSLIREVVRDSRFFCVKCGRSARESKNLCKPAQI